MPAMSTACDPTSQRSQPNARSPRYERIAGIRQLRGSERRPQTVVIEVRVVDRLSGAPEHRCEGLDLLRP